MLELRYKSPPRLPQIRTPVSSPRPKSKVIHETSLIIYRNRPLRLVAWATKNVLEMTVAVYDEGGGGVGREVGTTVELARELFYLLSY